MVEADTLKSKLNAARADSVSVSLTGAPGMWSDFNSANRSAMMRSELVPWWVTLDRILPDVGYGHG